MILMIKLIRRLRFIRGGVYVSSLLGVGLWKAANVFADIESERGQFWLYGTGSEHHVLYQYQIANSGHIFMGQIQTETP
jgi:hypothetical protein